MKVIKPADKRSFVHIEGDPEGMGPFEVKFQGVSLQLILVLRAFIAEWEEELLEMVQDGEEEETDIDFNDND